MMRMLFHWLTIVLGLSLITLIPPLGIHSDSLGDLLLAALVFWIFNAILKPILVILTLPLLLLTLGLFLLVINAVLLDWIPVFVHGYHVPTFWSAFFGAIVLSLFTHIFSRWERRSRQATVARGTRKIIDI
jgi:putative membrane protein